MTEREIEYRAIDDHDHTVTIPYNVKYAVLGRHTKIVNVPLSNARWGLIAVFTSPHNAKAWAKSFTAEMNKNPNAEDVYEYKAVELSKAL